MEKIRVQKLLSDAGYCSRRKAEALIAAGNADAGLGIYSAAKMYDLDFIPICDEEYDFLISEAYAGDPMVRAFLAALRSDEGKERLSRMGGYGLEE